MNEEFIEREITGLQQLVRIPPCEEGGGKRHRWINDVCIKCGGDREFTRPEIVGKEAKETRDRIKRLKHILGQ